MNHAAGPALTDPYITEVICKNGQCRMWYSYNAPKTVKNFRKAHFYWQGLFRRNRCKLQMLATLFSKFYTFLLQSMNTNTHML